MIDEYYTHRIYGYHSDDLSSGSGKRVVCVCEVCGGYRSLAMEKYNDTCKRCSDKKNIVVTMSKSKLRSFDPLPDGWQSKLSDITNNKTSSVYLGSIAETILSRIYNSVKVMPYGNPGYDVICNRDYKIDIKSSATGDKSGRWSFVIKRNHVADYFLCIAFNSRNDLYNPVHLWLIPGNTINHLYGLSISKANVHRWHHYELPLDNLQQCCTTLQHTLQNKWFIYDDIQLLITDK